MIHREETLAKDLVIAGLESMRQLGGEDLVQVMLQQPGMPDFRDVRVLPDRVPITDFLNYRDAALSFFEDAFAMTAFQTGQLMVERLAQGREGANVRRLVQQFRHGANPLIAVGQVAILAAAGNPGRVTATVQGDGLIIAIENCPECRGLKHATPICYLNQGVTTEFARRFLNLAVRTEEIRCMALGDPRCEIRVTRVD